MNIEVKTAVNGCNEYCPYFKVEVINLYTNNEIYHRTYHCEHLAMCEAMAKAMERAELTKTVENIY